MIIALYTDLIHLWNGFTDSSLVLIQFNNGKGKSVPSPIWAKFSLVPDTSVTHFVLQSLNQYTDETKQCMSLQINTGAKFCSTISF